MSKANESLRVSPAELRTAAQQVEGHAAEFAEAHRHAHAQASGTALGSGQAGAMLPQMLEAWEKQGEKFGEHFVRHADAHRDAADAYEKTDEAGATEIDVAGSDM